MIRNTVLFNWGGISFASKKTTKATNFCAVLHSGVRHFKRYSSNVSSV